MGDPRLLEVAQKVKNFGTPVLHTLIQDMWDTMESLDGAGLAAPQIGVGLQVVIFGVKHNRRYPDAEEVPYTVLLNPVLTPLTERDGAWLGGLPERSRAARNCPTFRQAALSRIGSVRQAYRSNGRRISRPGCATRM